MKKKNRKCPYPITPKLKYMYFKFILYYHEVKKFPQLKDDKIFVIPTCLMVVHVFLLVGMSR